MVSPDKSSMARNLQQTHSNAPTHRNFTEVLKVPFSFCRHTAGLCYFIVICHSWRPQRIGHKWVLHIKREIETLFGFVEWKEILKHCAMVPQKFWNVVRAFCHQSVLEPVRWRRGLHVASIQNGVLPHSTCKYHLLSYCLNSPGFVAPEVTKIVSWFGFVTNFNRETFDTQHKEKVLFQAKCLIVSSTWMWIQHTKESYILLETWKWNS